MQTFAAEIGALIDRGALYVAHHSADQDGQAMLPYLRTMVPASQLLAIPAPLPGVERDASKGSSEMPVLPRFGTTHIAKIDYKSVDE
ncbi:MAG: hypothetical protein QGG75_19870, partial [Alphaproteobacteria bacterium]|nr:hypothetical protein [Alphaproteobacteria bacterium]